MLLLSQVLHRSRQLCLEELLLEEGCDVDAVLFPGLPSGIRGGFDALEGSIAEQRGLHLLGRVDRVATRLQRSRDVPFLDDVLKQIELVSDWLLLRQTFRLLH